MSTAISSPTIANAPPKMSVADVRHNPPEPTTKKKVSLAHDYKGFVAGVGSGIAKLSGIFFPGLPILITS